MAQEWSNTTDAAANQILNTDVLNDVMSRVDGTTLARLSCVSTQFRSVSEAESLWQNVCNQRWPSTKQTTTLVSSFGGFRKLYNNCFPFVSQPHHREQDDAESNAESLSLAADFVSIVDVTYNGDPVLSVVVDGIPGATSSCGPLVDIFGAHGVAICADDGDEGPVVTIHTKSIARTHDGRFWLLLCNQLRVSWILFHKKTRRMVNLASWKPLSGVQHRPCGDNHFLLRFGSILPNPNPKSTPVHCNITMRCRPLEQPSATTVVKLTDLGLTLEDIHSVHLRGEEALAVLSRAMRCDKTGAEGEVATKFHEFIATQTANREALIRREKHREKAHAVLFVGVIVVILISHVLV